MCGSPARPFSSIASFLFKQHPLKYWNKKEINSDWNTINLTFDSMKFHFNLKKWNFTQKHFFQVSFGPGCRRRSSTTFEYVFTFLRIHSCPIFSCFYSLMGVWETHLGYYEFSGKKGGDEEGRRWSSWFMAFCVVGAHNPDLRYWVFLNQSSFNLGSFFSMNWIENLSWVFPVFVFMNIE